MISMNCPECKQTFTVKRSLTRHIKTKHEKKEDSNYTCEHCNKDIKRKDNYERHKQNCEKKIFIFVINATKSLYISKP